MAKPDLGTKRLCGSCGAKFYDLNKSPIVCPKCETVFVPVVAAPRTRPDAPKAPVAEAVVPETADAEFVSLEDAEAEQQGKKPAAAGAETAEGAGEEADDDTIFIEEQEEEGAADVSDIVGEGVEKEEEN